MLDVRTIKKTILEKIRCSADVYMLIVFTASSLKKHKIIDGVISPTEKQFIPQFFLLIIIVKSFNYELSPRYGKKNLLCSVLKKQLREDYKKNLDFFFLDKS